MLYSIHFLSAGTYCPFYRLALLPDEVNDNAPNGTTGVVYACYKGLNESHLTSAISFEVRSGCRNMYYRTMGFSNFLHSKLSKWCSPSNQFCTQTLLEELSGYSTANIPERSKFLNKVKKMRPTDHFEIREYNIDRLEEAEEQHAHVEKRPYPLYPSKAGLKPSFLRDIIARDLGDRAWRIQRNHNGAVPRNCQSMIQIGCMAGQVKKRCCKVSVVVEQRLQTVSSLEDTSYKCGSNT